jgi:hypothetical protein
MKAYYCVTGSIRPALATIFAAILLVTCVAIAHGDDDFSDVPKDHWAYKAVTELHDKGILIGYPNGTFNSVVPKGTPKPKQAYDISTPENTWRSLLRAMATGDEHEMGIILTTRCWTHDVQSELSVDLKSASRTDRCTVYSVLSAKLSKRKLLIDLTPVSDNNEIFAVLDDGRQSDFIGGSSLAVQMNRIKNTWQITAILHSTD